MKRLGRARTGGGAIVASEPINSSAVEGDSKYCRVDGVAYLRP